MSMGTVTRGGAPLDKILNPQPPPQQFHPRAVPTPPGFTPPAIQFPPHPFQQYTPHHYGYPPPMDFPHTHANTGYTPPVPQPLPPARASRSDDYAASAPTTWGGSGFQSIETDTSMAGPPMDSLNPPRFDDRPAPPPQTQIDLALQPTRSGYRSLLPAPRIEQQGEHREDGIQPVPPRVHSVANAEPPANIPPRLMKKHRQALQPQPLEVPSPPPDPDMAQESWQKTERASARLVAVQTSRSPSHAGGPQSWPDSLNGPLENQAQTKASISAPPAPPSASGSSTKATKRKSPSDTADDASEVPVKKAKRMPKMPKKTKAGKESEGQGVSSKAEVPTAKKPSTTKKRNEAVSQSHTEPVIVQGPTSTLMLYPELQFARCMSQRYKSEPFPRCVSCTRRWAGDTCRFQNIRFLLKDDKRNVVGVSFAVINRRVSQMSFPSKWNVEMNATFLRQTMVTVAKAMLPVLRKELEHYRHVDIVRRPRESEVRATCDTCMTSLFSSSWMCRLCGREACNDCFEEVKRYSGDIDPLVLSTTPIMTKAPLERGGPSSSPLSSLSSISSSPSSEELTTIREHQIQTPQEVEGFLADGAAAAAAAKAAKTKLQKHTHANPFFLYCTKRVDHKARDFTPMTRFFKEELQENIAVMEALLLEVGAKEFPPAEDVRMVNVEGHAKMEEVDFVPISFQESSEPQQPLSSNAEASQVANPMDNSSAPAPENLSSQPWPNGRDIPSHSIRTYSDPADLTEAEFQSAWAYGEPILVQNMLDRFKLKWDPEYFIKEHGTQACQIVDCQDEKIKKTTVATFFKEFGKYEERRGRCYKLKDWPPSSDFKEAFPNLFVDFSDAIPAPNYVRRDGVCNISSHFPTNAVAPDIGPKMYNSQSSTEEEGTKGSTRLHMDMADALNIMLHTEKQPDGSPGCAIWDLFRSEDAEKIRDFLRRKYDKAFPGDPIHSQTVYLDNRHRQQLLEEEGVKSWRVYQQPGDAVFIPAGCAHQVCNLSDSIKIAIDFVSPENIERCEKLTREFRDQNQAVSWKEDVLQLRSMMWFAWLSCRQQQDAGKKEAATKKTT